MHARILVGMFDTTVLGLFALVVTAAQPVSASTTLFPDPVTSVGTFPSYIASGDLDQDGIGDIVTVNRDSVDLSVLLGIGGGDFASELRLSLTIAPRAVAIADLDLREADSGRNREVAE